MRVKFREIEFTGASRKITLCLSALPVYALTADFNPLIQLLSVSAVASLAYLAALWALEKETLLRMLNLVGFGRSMRAAGKSSGN